MRHSRLPPLSFLQPAGRGLEARFSRRGTMRAIHLPGSFLSSFSALDVNATPYLATEFSACEQVGLYLFKRDAFFMPPRPGDQHVLNILPECPVFLEVDYRRRPAASRVGNKLNSGHGPYLLGSRGACSRPLRCLAPSTE